MLIILNVDFLFALSCLWDGAQIEEWLGEDARLFQEEGLSVFGGRGEEFLHAQRLLSVLS